MMKKKIDYKYNESNNILELLKYVNSTYEQHYSKTSLKQLSLLMMVVMAKVSVLVIL